MDFLQAAICGVLVFTGDRDVLLYDGDDELVPGRLLPLSTRLMELVRNMGMQDTLRCTWIQDGYAERAMRQSLETDSTCRLGVLWYDFDTGT